MINCCTETSRGIRTFTASFWFTLQALLHFNIGRRGVRRASLPSSVPTVPLWDVFAWDLPELDSLCFLLFTIAVAAYVSECLSSMIDESKKSKIGTSVFWYAIVTAVHSENFQHGLGSFAFEEVMEAQPAEFSNEEFIAIASSVVIFALLSELTASFIQRMCGCSAAKQEQTEKEPPRSRISGDDIASITNLLNRVMITMDRGDGDAFARCFLEKTGSVKIAINGANAVGRTSLAALCSGIYKKFCAGEDGGLHCRHWEGNVCISSDGDRSGHASNTSYWKALNGGTVVSTGLHIDELVLINGEWMLSSRRILHTWTKGGGHIDVATTSTRPPSRT